MKIYDARSWPLASMFGDFLCALLSMLNMSFGSALEVPSFSTGDLLSETTLLSNMDERRSLAGRVGRGFEARDGDCRTVPHSSETCAMWTLGQNHKINPGHLASCGVKEGPQTCSGARTWTQAAHAAHGHHRRGYPTRGRGSHTLPNMAGR